MSILQRGVRRGPRRSVAEAAGVEPPRSVDDFRRRFRTWGWPAAQMAVAAGLAWLLSDELLASPTTYAPITAIVAMGLGRERRIWRSVVLASGLLLGTVVAELAGSVLGVGWWQAGLILGVSGLVAGLLFDRDLAVTYATINAVVLHGTPSSGGWLPTRLIDGLLGVAAALLVTFVVAPSHPHRQLANRLRVVAGGAADGLESVVEMSRQAEEVPNPQSLRDAAWRIDRELQRVPGTVEHALDLARWSPIRRPRADDVEQLVRTSSPLVDALTTASTVVRLADRAAMNQVALGSGVLEGVDRAATAIRTLVDDIVEARRPGERVARDCREAVETLVSDAAGRAVVISIDEEVRGLLDDLISISDDLGSGDADELAAVSKTRAATVEGIRFGGAAGP